MKQIEIRIRNAVQLMLKRNPYTAEQPIEIHVQGRVVILTGSVESEDIIYEAVATAEAVSSKLEVYSELAVQEETPAYAYTASRALPMM